jgi:hypothetical protein
VRMLLTCIALLAHEHSSIDVELRLSGVPAAQKKSVAQKHQLCASLLVRLRPPPPADLPEHEHDNDEDSLSSFGSGGS